MDSDTQREIAKQLNNLRGEIQQEIDQKIRDHRHEGLQSTQVNAFDLFGHPVMEVTAIPTPATQIYSILSATIATTGNTDIYVIAPMVGVLSSILFSGVDALAASDTNYITWTITNLGQAGAGTNAMLSSSDANTTKSTGGAAISANTKKTLTKNTTASLITVLTGDRLLIRAAVTGTLANTVTFPTYMLQFDGPSLGDVSIIGTTDAFVVAPFSGNLISVDFSGGSALSASDTNYVTWTVTNLGQTGSGTTEMLATVPAGINTTKSTGGTAISASTKYPLTISAVSASNNDIKEGDRLRIRATVTGILASHVTFPSYTLRFR